MCENVVAPGLMPPRFQLINSDQEHHPFVRLKKSRFYTIERFGMTRPEKHPLVHLEGRVTLFFYAPPTKIVETLQSL
jgi:hypothetical protein